MRSPAAVVVCNPAARKRGVRDLIVLWMQNPAATHAARHDKSAGSAARPCGKGDAGGGGNVSVDVKHCGHWAAVSERPQRRANLRGFCLALCALAIFGCAAGIWALIKYVF